MSGNVPRAIWLHEYAGKLLLDLSYLMCVNVHMAT